MGVQSAHALGAVGPGSGAAGLWRLRRRGRPASAADRHRRSDVRRRLRARLVRRARNLLSLLGVSPGRLPDAGAQAEEQAVASVVAASSIIPHLDTNAHDTCLARGVRGDQESRRCPATTFPALQAPACAYVFTPGTAPPGASCASTLDCAPPPGQVPSCVKGACEMPIAGISPRARRASTVSSARRGWRATPGRRSAARSSPSERRAASPWTARTGRIANACSAAAARRSYRWVPPVTTKWTSAVRPRTAVPIRRAVRASAPRAAPAPIRASACPAITARPPAASARPRSPSAGRAPREIRSRAPMEPSARTPAASSRCPATRPPSSASRRTSPPCYAR